MQRVRADGGAGDATRPGRRRGYAVRARRRRPGRKYEIVDERLGRPDSSGTRCRTGPARVTSAGTTSSTGARTSTSAIGCAAHGHTGDGAGGGTCARRSATSRRVAADRSARGRLRGARSARVGPTRRSCSGLRHPGDGCAGGSGRAGAIVERARWRSGDGSGGRDDRIVLTPARPPHGQRGHRPPAGRRTPGTPRRWHSVDSSANGRHARPRSCGPSSRSTSRPRSRSGPRRWPRPRSLGVSSATVRNDMTVLEREGYLVQPHTSAGRIPTDLGYRYFVDHFTKQRALARGRASCRRRVLRNRAHRARGPAARDEPAAVPGHRHAAVVVGPPRDVRAVRRVQLVSLQPTPSSRWRCCRTARS